MTVIDRRISYPIALKKATEVKGCHIQLILKIGEPKGYKHHRNEASYLSELRTIELELRPPL